jgi:hypothetical protein
MSNKKKGRERAYDAYCRHSEQGLLTSAAGYQGLWAELQANSLQFDLIDPLRSNQGTVSMRMVLELYGHVEEARAFIGPMIKGVGGQQSTFDGLMEVLAHEAQWRDEFMAQMDALIDCCIAQGAQLRDIELVYKCDPEVTVFLFEKQRALCGSLEGFVSKASYDQLASYVPCLSAHYQIESPPETLRLDARMAKQKVIYAWLKRDFGLAFALGKFLGNLEYECPNPHRVVMLATDLAEVFTGGDLFKLLDLHRQATGTYIKNVSKLAMLLVLQQPDFVDVLEGLPRAVVAHWRKSGYVDDVQWIQLVETTIGEKEDVLAKGLGL